MQSFSPSYSRFRGNRQLFARTSFRVLTLLIALCSLAVTAGLLLSRPPAVSAVTTVPTKMNFQGRLTDASGNTKPNGTYNMRFKLFTVASAGTNVWSEDRLVSAAQGVTVTNGLFSVQLGSVTSLPASLFASGALYLEVELPTPASATSSSPVWTEGPMTPRNQMATSAYAYNSETLDGQDGAWYQDAANLTGTVSAARLSGSYTGITGTGALAAGSITTGFGTILTGNTISGTQLISTVATGTAPLTVTSTTVVTNLNADLLDGQSGAYYQSATNLNAGTIASARVTGSYAGITGTGALAAGSIASGFGTISTGSTITGTQLSSTVVTGTAPLTVASTTKVTSLNADLLDGFDSTAFGDATAANQTTILNRIGTSADVAGTTTVFARLASIDTSKLGATGDAASSTGSIFARLAYLISSIGATTDAANSTGSVNAKLAYLISNGGGTGLSPDVQTFNTTGTWTKPANAKRVVVQVWGAGGGGSGNSSGEWGGGGGGYAEIEFSAGQLTSTVTATVGAGGNGGLQGAYGSDGGDSTFGAYIKAFGGKAGNPTVKGRGGGNTFAHDATTTIMNAASTYGGGSGGYVSGHQFGGDSTYGGGGGATRGGVVGKSGFGGDGGAGGNGLNAPGSAGTAPGGGGGSSYGGQNVGGAGAAGRIIVKTYF